MYGMIVGLKFNFINNISILGRLKESAIKKCIQMNTIMVFKGARPTFENCNGLSEFALQTGGRSSFELDAKTGMHFVKKHSRIR